MGRPGDAKRGCEPRHFPFPSTCPTWAPGLGLCLQAASVPKSQSLAPRSPGLGKWGAGEGAGHLAGASPRTQDPTPPKTRRLNGERESYIKHE